MSSRYQLATETARWSPSWEQLGAGELAFQSVMLECGLRKAPTELLQLHTSPSKMGGK